MKLDELTIGEAREIAGLFAGNPKQAVKDGGVRIVVLQRGWIAVGRYSQDGYNCKLDDASIIRNWGTTKGLPQLIDGPLEGKTVLDKSSTAIRFHEMTVVLTLDCKEEGWKKYL